MKLLYFEDDLIDQKLFKRLMNKSYSDVEVFIVSNEEEFQLILKKMDFDLILVDQFIDSMHVFNYLKGLFNQKIVLVSGIDTILEEENAKEVHLEGFLVKPIMKEDLDKYIRKNLSAIEKLADGDQDFLDELTETIKGEIENEVVLFYENESNEEKANWIHKTKSKVALLEFFELYNKAMELEKDLREDKNCDTELIKYHSDYQQVLKQL